MKLHSVLCLLMAIAPLLGAGCKKKEASTPTPTKPATSPDSVSATPTNPGPENQTEAAKAFIETVDRLTKQKLTRGLNAQESFELAVGLFATGNFSDALGVATNGMNLTKDPREQSLFYIIASQCQGAKGDYRVAAETASEGQKLNSQSVELAALRYAYFTKVGDLAQIEMAKNTLEQLKPSGQPVSSGQMMAFLGEAGKILSAIIAVYQVLDGAWKQIQPEVEKFATTLKAMWPKESPGGTSRIKGTSSAR